MRVILIGNGGHSKVIQDMIRVQGNIEISAILDDRNDRELLINETIFAPLSSLNSLLDSEAKIIVAIGSHDVRQSIVQRLSLSSEKFLTVIHPSAIISPFAVIGNGTVIMPNAVVNANSLVGSHCIINTGAIIEHDNKVGDFSHISPNATLTGNVTVGEGVHIGASATIIPGIEVGYWSIVGAGSTVIRNIPSNSKAVGSPTRFIDLSKQLLNG